MAAEGAHTALVDVDGAAVETAAKGIEAVGGSVVACVGDVTDETRMAEIMSEVAGAGGIDVLINNAALHSDEYGLPIAELGLGKTRRMFDVNVMGVLVCTLAAKPFMIGRKGANILNIASAAAHVSWTAYGASKLAVAGLTIALARELGAEGIRVNAVSPGMIPTDTIRAEVPETIQTQIKGMQFLATDAAESDVVDAMLFLTSDRARFITGETLRVTGGLAAGT